MKYANITLGSKKAVRKRVLKIIQRHGFDETKCIINKFFAEAVAKKKLQKEIREREQELRVLRSVRK